MKPLSAVHRRYLLLIGILILVIFYLYKCTPTPVPQITTTTKVLKDTVRLIEQDRKHLTDSFNAVLKKQYAENYKNESDFIKLANQNAELSVINERLQQEIVPDTCKGIVKKYQDAYGNYEAQTNRTIEQAKKSLISLSGTVQTQKKFLDEKDKLYSRLKAVNDTCLANSAAMEKYIKKAKPKRSINLNVQAISPYIGKMKPEFGAGIGYENRKGLEVSFTYYTNQQISIRISKQLFRF